MKRETLGEVAAAKRQRQSASRDWVSKSVAGAFGGFGLAIALSGWFVLLTPGAPDAQNKFQVAMWLVPPVWIGAMSAVFALRDGRRAWTWFGGANVVAFLLLALARHFLRS